MRVDLRPLTLLYGRNNSGKSAVARFPSILAALASPANELGSLSLESPAARKARFSDLFHKSVPADMEFALHWERGGDIRTVRFSFIEQGRRALIASIEVWGEGDQRLLEAVWEGRSHRAYDITQPKQRYEFRVLGDAVGTHPLAFRGVYPDLDESTIPDAARTILREVATRLRTFSRSVQWLQASRPQSDRTVAALDRTGGRAARLDPSGGNAAAIVAARRDVGEWVQRWYYDRTGAAFSVDSVGGNQVLSRFSLGAMGSQGAHVADLIDAGEGMIQVLPIVTGAALLAHREEGDPSILAMEEPESHLHGDLQIALAEDLCELSSRPDAGVLLVETHSEAFLVGVQRAVLRAELARRGELPQVDAISQGKRAPAMLPSDSLALYWASLDRATGSSQLRRVELDDQSRLSDAWPSSAFEDIADVTDELFLLRQRVRASR